jgi:hypothetical protein
MWEDGRSAPREGDGRDLIAGVEFGRFEHVVLRF